MHRFAQSACLLCLQEPQCYRKALLAYFGEKHAKCDKESELQCDFCQDWKACSRTATKLQEALEAKHMAAVASQQQSMVSSDNAADVQAADLPVQMNAQAGAGQTDNLASSAASFSRHQTSPSDAIKQPISTPARPVVSKPPLLPRRVAVWNAAAAGNKPDKPLMTHDVNLLATVSSGAQLHRAQEDSSQSSQTEPVCRLKAC